jgi:hypothetical protein
VSRAEYNRYPQPLAWLKQCQWDFRRCAPGAGRGPAWLHFKMNFIIIRNSLGGIYMAR